MEPRLAHHEPVRLAADGGFAVHQGQDRLQPLVHHPTLLHGLDAQHVGVGGKRARAHAEHGAAAGHVVELHHALGQDVGVVVGQAGHARAQPDVPRALRRLGDEHLGRGDQLPARAVMLTDPGLVVAQVVQPLD